MKKRLLACLLTLVMLLALLPATALAVNEPNLSDPEISGISGGVVWTFEKGTLTITPTENVESGFAEGQMAGNYGTLSNTDAAYGKALTDAGYLADGNGRFHYPDSNTWVSDSPWKFLGDRITKIVIADGVINIGARAFRLPNVTEVSIPATVNSIGMLAFEACEKLTTVKWTGDWTNHAEMAFNGFSRCTSLGKGYELTAWMPACFYVDASTDSIEGTQFTVDFDALNRRLHGETYTRAMFRNVPNVDTVTLTEKFNVQYVFENSGIRNVTLSDSLTNIAGAAFHGCRNLASIVIPKDVATVSGHAFQDSGLKSVTFTGLACPTFGSAAFSGVELDTLTLNKNMSMSEAAKVIAALKNDNAITSSTQIIPEKFAYFAAEDVTVDGSLGEEINQTNFSAVKHLTINGAYTSRVDAFGKSAWGGALETLVINAPGEDVTINETTFRRIPLKSVKITAKNLTFTGDAAFLNNMLLTRVDLTGVDQITVGEKAKRTFEFNEYNNGGLSVPTRYVYLKNADTYNALMQGGADKHFGGNTNTYYLVTNGGMIPTSAVSGADPVMDGYKFDGWFTDAALEDKAEDFIAGTVYYAKWTESSNVIDGKEDGARMSVDLGTIVEGQTTSQTVTFKAKEGQTANPLDHVLFDSGIGYFDAVVDGMTVTVSPSSSLTPGTYRDTLHVYTKSGAVHFIDVTLTVTPLPTPEPAPVVPVTPSAPAKNPFNLDAGKTKFVDVSDNAWYASAVNYAVDKGLMNGTGNGKFSPEADTTRGMIVTILARLDGKNTSGTPWYQAGQRWAMEYEISDGTNMTGAITREQLVTMLFRYAVKNGLEAVTLSENLTQFTDASDISAWAVSAMQWAVGQGLIQGSNGQLRPQANASRAEVATILMRFCELLNK